MWKTSWWEQAMAEFESVLHSLPLLSECLTLCMGFCLLWQVLRLWLSTDRGAFPRHLSLVWEMPGGVWLPDHVVCTPPPGCSQVFELHSPCCFFLHKLKLREREVSQPHTSLLCASNCSSHLPSQDSCQEEAVGLDSSLSSHWKSILQVPSHLDVPEGCA